MMSDSRDVPSGGPSTLVSTIRVESQERIAASGGELARSFLADLAQLLTLSTSQPKGERRETLERDLAVAFQTRPIDAARKPFKRFIHTAQHFGGHLGQGDGDVLLEI